VLQENVEAIYKVNLPETFNVQNLICHNWTLSNTADFEIIGEAQHADSVRVRTKEFNKNTNLTCSVAGVEYTKQITTQIKIVGPSAIPKNSIAEYTLSLSNAAQTQWTISDNTVFGFQNTNADTLTATSVRIKPKKEYTEANLIAVIGGRTIKKTISIQGKHLLEGSIQNDTLRLSSIDVCIPIKKPLYVKCIISSGQLFIRYSEYRTMRLVKTGISQIVENLNVPKYISDATRPYIESRTEAGRDRFIGMLIRDFDGCTGRCNAPFKQGDTVTILQQSLQLQPRIKNLYGLHEKVGGSFCSRTPVQLYFPNRTNPYLVLEKLPAAAQYKVSDYKPASVDNNICKQLKQHIRRK
jgi:hypothetical protein